ncbi:AfsR/SARP family transcriptional regulator [Kallotenue papyrolyticum]|uniref:AfsR/SARP family transcriptional regulator n=1 Tax=Kallotenue papyrolyticum TaxID=1325125 RepID=UPI0004923E19|nr:tetratricopeptide repeat protein [Kallotenue papyrolyticum]
MAQLALYLFGPPRLERDGVELEVDTRKALALLAYLALERQAHSRETLATLLWPEYSTERAYANLRRTIWSLNRALGREMLEINRDTVLLPPEADLWIDVETFRERLATPARHAHSPQQLCTTCLAALSEAAQLYRSDFMLGFRLGGIQEFDNWQFMQAESLRQQLAAALERLVQGYSAQRDFAAALNYARRWLLLDPLHEPAHQWIMRVYVWAGQRSAALRQYQECVNLLHEQLGVEPQAETRELYHAIKDKHDLPLPEVLLANEHAPSARPATPQIHESREEYHEEANDLASAAANLPPLVGREAELATIAEALQADDCRLLTLVGREAELATIAEALQADDCRLLTLVGPGGVGKTRLALAALAEYGRQFRQGAAFVSCTAVPSSTVLISAIADAVRFSFYGIGDPLQQLTNYLRQRQMLIILDNFEHLTEATEVLRAIVTHAPQVKLIVTSIERLQISGEWVLDVPSLAVPPPGAEAEAERYSAVQLFVNAARRLRSDFALDDAARPAVAQICRLVDGLPLGIELAASWIRSLACEEIAQEVERSLDFLATSLRDIPERHRSLRAVLDYSWNLLDQHERHVLLRLAVFPGSFDRHAAQAIADADLGMLADLIDKSFLRKNLAGRYELLSMVRHYTRAQLAADPTLERQAHQCHTSYYAELLRRWGPLLSSAQQSDALRAIGSELENIRAGALAATDYDLPALVPAFVEHPFFFYEIQSRFAEGLEYYTRLAERLTALPALDAAQQREQERLHATAQAYRGALRYRLGQYDLATELLEASLHAFQHSNDAPGIAFCLTYLGDIYCIRGDYDSAQQLLERARTLCSDVNDQHILGGVLLNLGVVAGTTGQYEVARQLFQESLQISRKLRNRWNTMKALINLGNVAYFLQEYDHSRYLTKTALEIAESLQHYYGLAVCLNNLGCIAYEQGQYEEARQLHERSCQIFSDIGYRLGMIYTYNDLGRVARAQGHPQTALSWLQKALREANELQATPLLLDTLLEVARLLHDQEQDERARRLLQQIVHHPATVTATREQAAELLAQLGAADDLPAGATPLEQLVNMILGWDRLPGAPAPAA